MTRSEHLAVGAMLGVVLWWVVLPWLLPADELVYRWLQFHWGGPEDRVIRWCDRGVQIGLGALVGASALAVARKRIAAVFEMAALVGGGAIVNEFLKTAIERLRPQSVSAMCTGNSFPSGHVMNTTLLALAACRLVASATRSTAVRRTVDLAAVACIVTQAVCRLALEAHWPSDLPVSVLLAAAWFYGAPSLRRLPQWGIAAVAGAFGIAFLVFYQVPAVRFRLPSAMDDQGAAQSSVEFGTPGASSALVGSWSSGHSEPIGPVAWMLAQEASVRVPQADGRVRLMKLTARPQSCGKANMHGDSLLAVTVNDWSFPPFRLRRGWREYHLELPAGILKDEGNTVTFRVEGPRIDCPAEGDSGLVAFRYLRLYPVDHAGGPSG